MCHINYPEWPQTITTTNMTMCNKRILGTCSQCGGRVSVPGIWMGINPPSPTCECCGAVCHGPVIDMGPPPITYIPTMPTYPVERVYKMTDILEPKGRKVREGRGWE